MNEQEYINDLESQVDYLSIEVEKQKTEIKVYIRYNPSRIKQTEQKVCFYYVG